MSTSRLPSHSGEGPGSPAATWCLSVLGLLGIVWASTIAACVSLERMAPSVDGTVAELGQKGSYSVGSLERGRRIYLTKCSKCHSIEAIDRYTMEQWRQILPGMAEEASLEKDELADLHGYIETAHRFMTGTRSARAASGGVE